MKLPSLAGWAGFASGFTGSLLVACGHSSGFGWYLASNVLWIAQATRTRNWPLLLQMLAFTLTSCIGIWRAV